MLDCTMDFMECCPLGHDFFLSFLSLFISFFSVFLSYMEHHREGRK